MRPPPLGPAATAAILATVRRIPPGWVATYAQVAALAGYPRRARLVARVLATLPDGADIPWHRVINAGGRIAYAPSRAGSDHRQRLLLEQEGVTFNASGRCDLERYRWPE